MKFSHFIVAIFLLSIIVSLSGCKDKVWVYDFVYEGSLVREEEVWSAETSSYSFDEGLILTANRVTGPHFYSGDFTVTVEFDLHTSPTETAYFEFWLGTDALIYSSIWSGGINFNFAGSPSSTIDVYRQTTSLGFQNIYNAPAADLIYEEGGNVVKIEKKGDLLWIYINDTKISASVPITEYDGGILCPYLASWSSKVVYKKVTIEYQGDQILID